MIPHYLGMHALVELYGCNHKILNNKQKIKSIMIQAAKKSGATVVAEVFHNFSPHGLSGVVVVAESHLAIHTWPEYNCASVDFFSCSSKINFKKAIDYIKLALGAKSKKIKKIKRGEITKKKSS